MSKIPKSGKLIAATDDQSPAAGQMTELIFKKLIEKSNDGVSLLNNKLNIIYRSASAERINGWTTADRVKYPMNELAHPNDRDRLTVVLNNVLANFGRSETIIFRSKHFLGHYIWLECVYTNFLNDPDINAIVCNFRDITKGQQEKHHLKLLESVITNTTEAVLITEATPIDEPDPRIVYVNNAFTKMTGYTPADVTGKTPRILQGPKSDEVQLKNLSDCMRKKQVCEVTLINYKKNGDEFWVNYAVSPVHDEKGICTHFISIARDITERKNNELRQLLLTEISAYFNDESTLNETLYRVSERLADFTGFSMAEAWLIGVDKNKIQLSAGFPKTREMQVFYDETAEIKSFIKGEGLPGIVWKTQTLNLWTDVDTNEQFIRRKAAKKAGLKTLYGIPLKHNAEVTGVLFLGSNRRDQRATEIDKLVETVSEYLGAGIKRKQLELELNEIFNFTPDILCIANTDGFFKKVNPAMCAILEYNEGELLSRPFMQFVDPRDNEKTATELHNIAAGNPTYYIENRYITKFGKIKWLAWTTTKASEQGTMYCSAKDITDKKELEYLLNKATTLARIGSWEVNLLTRTIYWSDITREIHEVEPGYCPNIASTMDFYKKGRDRDVMVEMMDNAINNGTPGDVELQIVTGKGNTRWVRVIVEAEVADGNFRRVYGSIQDIDSRKKAEIASKQALEERNTILESIDDAFFAVDENWVVTYWNSMAEKLLETPRIEILNHNVWDVFSDMIDSESYKRYHEAVGTKQAVHFEDYYPPVNKWYDVSAYPSEKGLSIYFKDITDRKFSDVLLRELNSSLRKQARELAISNAELEQFAYVASHDLQEPLRMITSFMTQLEKKYGDVVDDKGRQYIHFAVDGAKRMRQIILDLLDFSRVGRTEDDMEDVDFNKLMNEIIALYRRQIEEEHASVTFVQLPIIHTYKTPVRQVLQNLLSNSLKYHKKGVDAIIHVDYKETETHYQISVKDNGIGIAPQFFDKIFIIFQRLHNKDEYSGTGMGLAITKKIIENMDGKIWVESEEGKGSTFYFTLLKK